jgi:hypothetical protein
VYTANASTNNNGIKIDHSKVDAVRLTALDRLLRLHGTRLKLYLDLIFTQQAARYIGKQMVIAETVRGSRIVVVTNFLTLVNNQACYRLVKLGLPGL